MPFSLAGKRYICTIPRGRSPLSISATVRRGCWGALFGRRRSADAHLSRIARALLITKSQRPSFLQTPPCCSSWPNGRRSPPGLGMGAGGQPWPQQLAAAATRGREAAAPPWHPAVRRSKKGGIPPHGAGPRRAARGVSGSAGAPGGARAETAASVASLSCTADRLLHRAGAARIARARRGRRFGGNGGRLDRLGRRRTRAAHGAGVPRQAPTRGEPAPARRFRRGPGVPRQAE